MKKHEGTELDTKAIWSRALKASNLRSMAALATALEMTPQALNTTNQRRSISLSLLLHIRQLTGRSMEYLLFGEGISDVLDGQEGKLDNEEYIYIDQANGGQVKILRELLLSAGKKGASNFLALVEDDRLDIVDISDTKLRDGFYLLGAKGKGIAIRKCKLLATGSVLIEDDTYSSEELVNIAVMGRVIWSGSKP